MKHSAKEAAKRERQRSRQERRRAGRRRAGHGGTGTKQPAGRDSEAAIAEPGSSQPREPGTGAAGPGPARGLKATASRVGAAAAGSAEHQRPARLPYAVVLAGVAAGLLLMLIAKDAVRSGTLVIAGALLAGSLVRLVLPEGRAGLLGSRRRLVDVALLTALGAGLLVAGFVVQVPG